MRLELRRPAALLLVVSLSCVVAGCMEPQTTAARPARIDTGFRTAHLNTNDYNAAFAAAESVVTERFQIASADRATGTIQLAPAEFTRLGGARVRRVGQVIVRNTGSYIVAAVQVQVEKYATPDMRAIQRSVSADDRPGVTPIQEEAGYTPQQQEYWMVERRDTAMEAQILNQIVEAINQVAQTTQPTATQPAPEVTQ